MPRTLSFPPPSATTCPICAGALNGPRCDACGAGFTGPDGDTLWRVDHDLFDLCRIRNDLVRRLLLPPIPAPAATPPAPSPAVAPAPAGQPSAPAVVAPATAPCRAAGRTRVGHRTGPGDVLVEETSARSSRPTSDPSPWARPDDAAGRTPDSVRSDEILAERSSARASDPRPRPPADPAGPGATEDLWPGGAAVAQGWWGAPGSVGGPGQVPPHQPPVPPTPPRARRPRPSLSAAEVLVGLGALSLVAAVAAVAAVRWSDLAAWAQGALVVGLTGLVATVAAACRRRHLIATAESLGAVTVALGLADVQVARVALDGAAPDRIVTAAGLAVVAAAGLALGRRTGIRSLVLAGTALALTPLVVAATASSRPTVWLAVLAAQAIAAGLIGARWPDRPLERAVIAVGAAASWIGAVTAALVLAAGGLAADPTAHPVGPAAVLALLAVGTIVAARRVPVETVATAVGGAGAALAFVPGLVLAVGVGEPRAVVTVLALQAIVGLALATIDRATTAEAIVARVGGALSWSAAAAGGLALAIGEIGLERSPTSTALVLAALAAGSILLARVRSEDRMAGVLAAAATGLAFAPAPLVALGIGDGWTLATVLAVQAGLALVAVVSPLPNTAERAAAVVAGALSWLAASSGGVVVGLVAVLDGDDATDPVRPALVLAALALATIAAGRVRTTERAGVPLDLMSAAGVALALVPGLVLVVNTTPTILLAVVAIQAIVALAATGLRRAGELVLLPAERAIAAAGGWALWAPAAAGSLVFAVSEIAFGARADRIGGLAIMAGLALASLFVGAAIRRPDLIAAGAALAFIPVPLGLIDLAEPGLLVLVIGAEALVAALLAPMVGCGPVRTVLRTGGVTTWLGAVAGATALGVAAWTDSAEPTTAVALLAGLAVLAGAASLLSGWDRSTSGLGLSAAVGPTLVAVAVGAGDLGAAGWVTAVLVATAVLAVGLVLLAERDPARPWTAPASVALAVGAVAAIVPAWSVLAVAAALVERAIEAPAVGADIAVADWLRLSEMASSMSLPGWATVGQLAALAGLAVAVGVLDRRVGRALGTVVAVAALAVVPVAAGLTVAVTTAGLGAAVAVAGLAIRRRPDDVTLLVGTAATTALGTAVAMASAPWTVAWTVLVAVVIGALAVAFVIDRSPDASMWVGIAVGTLLAGVALDSWVLGSTGIETLLVIAIAAGVVTPLAALLERREELAAADVVDALAACALGATLCWAPLATGDVFSASPFVAIVGVAAAGAALRPRRRPLWLVATASAVVLAWLQAGRSEIEVVEAYTLPLAAWAAVVGAVLGRGRGSWERFGIALLTAAGPTTVLALVDPDPVRTVAVVAVGAAVAIWGAAARLQAPLAIGAGAVAVVAVRHLGPVGVELPRYVAFAVAGLVLLAVGATFEQRRQDLREARDAFGRLG